MQLTELSIQRKLCPLFRTFILQLLRFSCWHKLNYCEAIPVLWTAYSMVTEEWEMRGDEDLYSGYCEHICTLARWFTSSTEASWLPFTCPPAPCFVDSHYFMNVPFQTSLHVCVCFCLSSPRDLCIQIQQMDQIAWFATESNFEVYFILFAPVILTFQL